MMISAFVSSWIDPKIVIFFAGDRSIKEPAGCLFRASDFFFFWMKFPRLIGSCIRGNYVIVYRFTGTTKSDTYFIGDSVYFSRGVPITICIRIDTLFVQTWMSREYGKNICTPTKQHVQITIRHLSATYTLSFLIRKRIVNSKMQYIKVTW